MKVKLDLENWNRREHFEFFKKFDEPFYSLNMDIDCTEGYDKVKARNGSLFIWYLYNAMKASNAIKEFKYRIEGDDVVEYEVVHASPTISRVDGTFGFAQVNYHDDFDVFQVAAKQEIDRVRGTKGLFTAPERIDVIHYSALPWFSFTGLSHPRNYNDGDSIPKISFGKIYKQDGRRMLPLSLLVHHGLIDGYHVGKYVEAFREFLVLDCDG